MSWIKFLKSAIKKLKDILFAKNLRSSDKITFIVNACAIVYTQFWRGIASENIFISLHLVEWLNFYMNLEHEYFFAGNFLIYMHS